MKFKGVNSPEVYVIDFHKEENSLEEYPLAGVRGNYVTSLLGSFSLLDKVRVANWTMQGAETVTKDIIATQPKVVVTFGSEAVKQFVNTSRKITDISGSVFDVKFGDFETKLLILVSPSYVLKHSEDTSVSLEFAQSLYKAFQIVNGEYKDILKEKEILSAHSFEEFKEIYDSKLKDSPKLSYDIETNARPPMVKGSEIIGFSLGNETSGVYVSHDSLEFHMSQEEIDKIWDFVKGEFDSKDKLIIHNTMYERPYTLYCKGYEISYDKAEDTLVMARLLKGAKEGAGLKYQAQKNLHYPDWETDLGCYISGFRGVAERIGLGPKKFQGLYSELSKKKINLFDYKLCESYRNLKQEDQEEVDTIIGKISSTVVDLYNKYELLDIGNLIMDKVIEVVEQGGILDSTIPYNWIPDRVLCKYGAVDALSTYDLYTFFMNEMDEESTDTVDLHKGYENWLEHMYVAYIMERNGMYFNDDLAEKDRKFLADQATRCLRSMLLSPAFKPYIRMCCEWKYKPLILSDYLPQVATCQGFEVKYDHDTDKYILKKDGKRVAKGRISEVEIFPVYEESYLELLNQMFSEEVNDALSYEELKGLYNPSSSTMSHIPHEILITPDLQMGGRIVQLHTLSESPEFEGVKDKIPLIDQKFLQVADLLCDAKKLKEMYGEEWANDRKQLYQGFCNLYNVSRNQVTTPEILEILNNKTPVEIESFDDGGIITVYNNLVVTGMDQDDPKTWTPEFEWMVNFRLFKKSSKIITSYIDGSVGRQSVAVVDKEQLSSGSHCVERKRRYYEGVRDDPDGHTPCGYDEDYLLMAKWSPNTAETGRWRSAQHTIPWGSQVKKYYTSRFKGGTTCCPDYSQMEVRTLAAISKDKNMLELFHSGKDFHTETAKKIYRKDEVTTAERRFSKTATFSLLYGAMEESFANNYCKGDMDYARMVYGGFFDAYPEVKKWVDARHEEVKRDHRVSLELSNRFIQIPQDGDSRGAINSMLRKAQNYPIQAQSADLTGCVIFDLQKYIEENNLKSLIFMYVHDSIEVDIYPYELLQFIAKLKVLLNESPMRRMGLPSKADVALGKSLGHEIELKSIEMNDEMTEGTLVLEGYKDEIDETVETWKEAYAVVEVSEEDYEDEFVSMGELFILRKAYTPTLGTLRHKGTCKVHIKYYN